MTENGKKGGSVPWSWVVSILVALVAFGAGWLLDTITEGVRGAYGKADEAYERAAETALKAAYLDGYKDGREQGLKEARGD